MAKEQRDTDITYYIRRFNPEHDQEPYWQQFTVHVEPGMTVLDGLHLIKGNQDPTLAWRYSCRMGVCGSCGMLINGKPGLACNTQILDITSKKLTIGPLPNFGIIKDLVPDLSTMLTKHTSLKPYIVREDSEEMENPTGEYYQTPEELLAYLQFTYCIKCGCCMAACPTMATDKEYLGPMPLAQAHRYNTDTRDGAFKTRKNVVATGHGVFRCHYAGECSNVCPKGVDPARAIQLMKRELVLDLIKLRKKRSPCKLLGKPEGVHRMPEIPDAPPFTVEK